MRMGAVHTHTHGVLEVDLQSNSGAEQGKKPADTLRLPPTAVHGSPECVVMGRRNLKATSVSHRRALWCPDDQGRRC